MNGFIFFGSDTGLLDARPERIAPVASAGACQHRSLPGGESLLTWGNAPGDIQVAVQGKGSWLVLSGYILEIQSAPDFNSQTEAAEMLLKMLSEACSDAAITHILRRVFGSFSFLYRNQARDLMVCISDRVASRPLWRKRQGRGWMVSSHPTAISLSVQSSRMDPTALGSFLLYGGAVEPARSLFQGVEAVPPGGIVRLKGGGTIGEHRWYQFRHQPDNQLSPGDWVDLAAERLVRAAARLLRHSKRPAIFFSGGVDSRLTAAALKAAGGDPLLVTLGDSRNVEVRVASAAARAMGLRHKIILRDSRWYLRALPRAVYETGSGYVFTHGHFSAAAAMVGEEFGADTFLLGDLGEAFSKLFCSADKVGSRLWTPEEFANVFDSIRLPLYRPQNRADTLSVLKPGVRADIEDAIRREILERYRKVASVSEDPLIVGDYCFRWESAPTLPTFYMFLDLRSTAAERNILFDPDVHELLERLPARMRSDMNLGARLIYRLQPLAGWVPNANSLLPMCWPSAAHKMSRRIKPVFGRLRRALLGDTYRTTGSWPKRSALYLGDAAWRCRFEDTLKNGDWFDPELFDRDAIRGCWQAFVGGDHRRAGDVEKLAQLGLMQNLAQSGAAVFLENGKLFASSGNAPRVAIGGLAAAAA
jgi:hypothetical protein